MWAEKKNNSRTGGKDKQERRRREKKRRRRKDEVMARKKKIKRRKEEEKNTARYCRDGEAEQEAYWFLSIYSLPPLQNRQGRGSAAAVLCAGQPSRWWEAVVATDDLWDSLPESPAEVPHVEAGSSSWMQVNEGTALASHNGHNPRRTLDDTTTYSCRSPLSQCKPYSCCCHRCWAANINGRNCLTKALPPSFAKRLRSGTQVHCFCWRQ